MTDNNLYKQIQLIEILNGLPAFVCLIDSDFNLRFSSKTFQKQQNEKSAPQKCYTAIWGYDSPCSGCQSAEVFASGQERIWEYHFSKEDKIFQIYDKFYTDNDGTRLILKMGIDITDRKMKDIKRHKKITQETLKTQKLESLGVLAGGIAHDFNNLLTVILGNISLIKILTNLDQKNLQLLSNAEEASLRARDLTNQLLSLTQSSPTHKVKMEVENFLVPAVKLALSGSNISYELNFSSNLWANEVDEYQIVQAIQNIVVNARDAMPAGGTLKISASNINIDHDELPPLKPGNYVVIAITDSGQGISPENMSKIFDPYFSNKQRGNQKGMGLGLTIAFSILKKHGGTITVESVQDIGTTVYLYLPALETKRPALPAIPQETILQQSRTKGTILIMDDERMVLDVMEKMLTLLGYQADCTTNGQEAVVKYSKAYKAGKPYQLVILDLTIPGGMGAEQTIIQIKEIDPQVLGLVTSGYSSHPIMQTPEDFGFKGAIAKPIKIEALQTSLDKILADTR